MNDIPRHNALEVICYGMIKRKVCISNDSFFTADIMID